MSAELMAIAQGLVERIEDLEADVYALTQLLLTDVYPTDDVRHPTADILAGYREEYKEKKQAEQAEQELCPPGPQCRFCGADINIHAAVYDDRCTACRDSAPNLEELTEPPKKE